MNLTREMALQFDKKGVQFNALCPGIFNAETWPCDPAAGIAFTPMGRVEEIARGTLFLAFLASDFMTAQTLVIDGGVLAR